MITPLFTYHLLRYCWESDNILWNSSQANFTK